MDKGLTRQSTFTSFSAACCCLVAVLSTRVKQNIFSKEIKCGQSQFIKVARQEVCRGSWYVF